MAKNKRDTVLARQEKVFRLRTEQSMTFRAISERVGVCERQVREDFKEAKKRRLQATPELDERLAEREACLEQLREVAWEEFDELKRAIGDEAEARIKASSALIGHLRLLMSLEERIAELRGVRLRHAKNGEPTSVNLKSAADMVSLLEQGASDALSIEDPEKRSGALMQVIRVAPEVLEKAGIEDREEEAEASRDTTALTVSNLDIYLEEVHKLVLYVRAGYEVHIDTLRNGGTVPELVPPAPSDAELMASLKKEVLARWEAQGARQGDNGSSG